MHHPPMGRGSRDQSNRGANERSQFAADASDKRRDEPTNRPRVGKLRPLAAVIGHQNVEPQPGLPR